MRIAETHSLPAHCAIGRLEQIRTPDPSFPLTKPPGKTFGVSYPSFIASEDASAIGEKRYSSIRLLPAFISTDKAMLR